MGLEQGNCEGSLRTTEWFHWNTETLKHWWHRREVAMAEAISLNRPEATGWRTDNWMKRASMECAVQVLVGGWHGSGSMAGPFCYVLYSLISQCISLFWYNFFGFLRKDNGSLYYLKTWHVWKYLCSTFILLDTEFWVGNHFPSAFWRCSFAF